MNQTYQMDGVQHVIQNANFKVQPTLKIDLVQFKRNLPCAAKNLTTVQKHRLKVNSQFLAKFDSNKKQSKASLKCNYWFFTFPLLHRSKFCSR